MLIYIAQAKTNGWFGLLAQLPSKTILHDQLLTQSQPT